MEEQKFSASPRVIKKDQVRLQSVAGAHSAASPPLPAIQLREEGGVVKAIELTCVCGGKIVIDCEYGKEERS